MKTIPLAIPDVLILEPARFGDDRGFFSVVFNRRALEAAGVAFDCLQINHAFSAQKGTLRGLHFQAPPSAQAKLVRVIRGAVFDVAVDIRAGSPTYGKSVATTLSAAAWNQVLVPRGFAHGYLTLEPDTEIEYCVDGYYDRAAEGGISWDDPDLAIDWPLGGIEPVLSDKDRALPRLAALTSPFSARG